MAVGHSAGWPRQARYASRSGAPELCTLTGTYYGSGMSNTAQWEREDAFRADAARVIQAMRHRLPARDAPPEVAALAEPVRQLASLLDAGAPADHLEEAALAVVDAYDWPRPDTIGGGEGPVIDAAILAAVERLRDAMDALDELDDGA